MFGVGNTRLLHSVALILAALWVVQVTTGFLLVGLLTLKLEVQFIDLLDLLHHCCYSWLVRIEHMLCSNMVMVLLIVHWCKSLTGYSVVNWLKASTWLVGAVIFLLGLGVAFTGYVLVAGNMSYWAMIVILNLVTVIPVVSDAVLESLLAGSAVSSLSIRRFLVLHFALALISSGIALVHVILVHRSAPSTSGLLANDGSQAIIMVLVKDAMFIAVTFMGLFSVMMWDLIHPDNWNSYDTLATPEHIEPEIYFLWTFAILKLHNGKLVGALLLLLMHLLFPLC